MPFFTRRRNATLSLVGVILFSLDSVVRLGSLGYFSLVSVMLTVPRLGFFSCRVFSLVGFSASDFRLALFSLGCRLVTKRRGFSSLVRSSTCIQVFLRRYAAHRGLGSAPGG
ncbi:hypothetical protein B0H16DRAFT_196140 [Mycena metata]|uniref:Uncharacterized protein n=1 Tax=Mycena metata TaxID=1033252 RepID=A0AAD7JW90_9AGAR|nr:hypothetical protein B0H16DRAFT_196140 [Mycena metata]